MQNENFGNYDPYFEETDWNLIAIKSVLVRNGVDVKINKLFSIGANLGLDWHPDIDVKAMPYFLDSKITLSSDGNDRFFVSPGIGKLLKFTENFNEGNYYKLGIGYEITGNEKGNVLINLDFHQKRILYSENGNLNSLSVGLGYKFL
jgi:hypothetical protein